MNGFTSRASRTLSPVGTTHRWIPLLCALTVILPGRGASAQSTAATIDSSLLGPAANLNRGDDFGASLAWLGDLNNDGFDEIAVGAPSFPAFGPGSTRVGRVYLFTIDHENQGTVLFPTEGGLGFGLGQGGTSGQGLGRALAPLGDLDGDCQPELAVGSDQDTVEIWSLDATGAKTVRSSIVGTSGFGRGLAGTGDVSGDGIPDLAVGAPTATGGSVILQALDANGIATSLATLAAPAGAQQYGSSVTSLGDLDGDGNIDLAIGAPASDGGRGSVHIVFLDPTLPGFVRTQTTISSTSGDLPGSLAANDAFGASVAGRFELTGSGFAFGTIGDGVPDLVVGAPGTDVGALDAGALWFLVLQPNGSVDTAFSFLDEDFEPGAATGSAVEFFRDIANDEEHSLAVGAENDGPDSEGAVRMDVGVGAGGFEPATNELVLLSPNPHSYSPGKLIIGRPWRSEVDLTTTGHTLAIVFGDVGPSTAITLGSGQILGVILVGDALVQLGAQPGPIARFCLPVPADPSLIGLPVTTQAIHLGGVVPFALSNAVEHIIGAY